MLYVTPKNQNKFIIKHQMNKITRIRMFMQSFPSNTSYLNSMEGLVRVFNDYGVIRILHFFEKVVKTIFACKLCPYQKILLFYLNLYRYFSLQRILGICFSQLESFLDLRELLAVMRKYVGYISVLIVVVTFMNIVTHFNLQFDFNLNSM